MTETAPDLAELVERLGDAQGVVLGVTRALLWWMCVALLVAFLVGDLGLFTIGVAVVTAAWLLRRYHVVPAGILLVLGFSGLVSYGGYRFIQQPRLLGWSHVGSGIMMTCGLVWATWAVVRYRRLEALFQKRIRERASATSNHALEPATGARHCSEER